MLLLDYLTPSIPELLGVLCFILGYVFLGFISGRTEPPVTSTDVSEAVEQALLRNDLEAAVGLIEEALKTEGFEDTKLANRVVRACVENKSVEKAMAVFELMKQSRQRTAPTAETFEIIAAGCMESRRTSLLLEVCKEAEKEMTESLVLQTLAVEAYARSSRANEAVALFETSHFKTELAESVLQALLKYRCLEIALGFYRTHRKMLSGADTLSRAVETAAKTEATEILREFCKDIEKPSLLAMTSVVKLLLRTMQIDEAIAVYVKFAGLFPTELQPFLLICDCCAKHSRPDAVHSLHCSLKAAGFAIPLGGYNGLLDAYIRLSAISAAWAADIAERRM
jgi:pentatricopeptide repeat protein